MPGRPVRRPEPDNAHLTGVILRLNPDGTTPTDNPFFAVGRPHAIGRHEVGANIQKVFAYGIRNSFGMAFDPVSGALWDEENGDDTFTEINRVEPGMNGGWVQVMGPLDRIAQFKEIETSTQVRFGLQQVRWSPANIADTPAEALCAPVHAARRPLQRPRVQLEVRGRARRGSASCTAALSGRSIEATCSSGRARGTSRAGTVPLQPDRQPAEVAVDDPRLEDRVADNLDQVRHHRERALLFGRNFGIGTDIETGPNGNLFVVSLSDGAIYEIHRAR